ncbi:Mitochondrial inner membrane protein oxa1l [Dermatophagoides pteronyssinus]|uniref:Mitochondrial inner membrane protein oxa1l n=1 Tax=Dermatophagoides pteronyssinus TaxID=6956 RepID=A0ABQ8IQ83_DERPT|nr:Mitochondrial inner membrane protein oxa1l [Dermatophagoides pteronyssinus]
MRSILILRNVSSAAFNRSGWKNIDKFSSSTLFVSDRNRYQCRPSNVRTFSSSGLLNVSLLRSHNELRIIRNPLIFQSRFNSSIAKTSDGDNVTTENVIDLTTIDIQKSPLLENETISNAVIETSVASLNLGSNYTPVGWCVHYLDFLHSVFPWWGAIAVGTVILRLCMFPLVVQAQRSAAKLNELLPEQAILKEKMNQARISGDSIEFARLSQESMSMYKRKGVNPFKAMLAPFAQAPVFITFFITLRRMAYHPVESLKTGGLFWFTDLSISDPLYALPLITCATLWLTLETSFRSGLNPNQTPFIKYGARIIPLITLAFTFNFPSAILMYWCTNNFISLLQVHLLRLPKVRNFLNIPQIKVKPQQLDINKKSFTQHFRETMDNAKINRRMEERNSLDEISFKKAGVGPLQKTYKHDPTSRN